jgi:hypothetical protein
MNISCGAVRIRSTCRHRELAQRFAACEAKAVEFNTVGNRTDRQREGVGVDDVEIEYECLVIQVDLRDLHVTKADAGLLDGYAGTCTACCETGYGAQCELP